MQSHTVTLEVPAAKATRWIIGKSGNVEVPAYRLSDGRVCISYYEGKLRRRKVFRDDADAKREAALVAAKINAGQQGVLQLTNSDRESYVLGLSHIARFNVALHCVAEEYAAARVRLPDGVSIAQAVEFYLSRNPAFLARKNVSEVVAEVVAAKEQDERSDRYLKTLRNNLKRFSKVFSMAIGDVTASAIDTWLRGLGVGACSRKNLRASLVTLFNFARARGYLPRERQTEADHVPRISAKAGDVGVFSPEEIAKLLANANEKLLPFLAIGAFAGLRTAEILRLEWADFRWDQGHIEISRAKSKTATRRLVPILPNLAAWLEPYKSKTGLVCAFKSMQNSAKNLGLSEKVKVNWRQNVLRHSFISYRVAVTRNVPQVAFECGNSPRMIDANYRELVTPKAAEEYFGIVPK